MKKIIYLFSIFMMVLMVSGCGNTAKTAVEKYLSKYNSLDDTIISDVDNIISEEILNDDQKETYLAVFKKQYSDLTYKIVSEEYDGDEAIIQTKIKVYDLYKAQKEAANYLNEHSDEFNDENGNYLQEKYIEYKLEQMKKATEKVEYTIDFYVVKTSDGWVVSEPSNSDIEKIHGIYDYES